MIAKSPQNLRGKNDKDKKVSKESANTKDKTMKDKKQDKHPLQNLNEGKIAEHKIKFETFFKIRTIESLQKLKCCLITHFFFNRR